MQQSFDKYSPSINPFFLDLAWSSGEIPVQTHSVHCKDVAGVGMVFLPGEPEKAKIARETIEEIAEQNGFTVKGWREVPVKMDVLGPMARDVCPEVCVVCLERFCACLRSVLLCCTRSWRTTLNFSRAFDLTRHSKAGLCTSTNYRLLTMKSNTD